MHSSLGDDIGVQAVAEVDRIDVVAVNAHVSRSLDKRAMEEALPLKITVHDREKDLQEQVDGVDQHREEVQPRLARHFGSMFLEFAVGDKCIANAQKRASLEAFL